MEGRPSERFWRSVKEKKFSTPLLRVSRKVENKACLIQKIRLRKTPADVHRRRRGSVDIDFNVCATLRYLTSLAAATAQGRGGLCPRPPQYLRVHTSRAVSSVRQPRGSSRAKGLMPPPGGAGSGIIILDVPCPTANRHGLNDAGPDGPRRTCARKVQPTKGRHEPLTATTAVHATHCNLLSRCLGIQIFMS
jgi:hypothetical protein